jgi:heme iron utilization protein
MPQSADGKTRQPDDAAAARALVRSGLKGALATVERAHAGQAGGHPYASLVTFATTPEGRPIFLLSGLALHTQNLRMDPRASLLIDATSLAGDPLAGGRVTVMGRIEVSTAPSSRTRFLSRHPASAQYADFGDFAFYELHVERAHFIGGFGRIAPLAAADLLLPSESSAAFAVAEADIVAHMNADHAETAALYATRLAGKQAGAWRVTGCDPEGLDLLAGEQAARVSFEEPVTVDTLPHVLKRLADKARALA